MTHSLAAAWGRWCTTFVARPRRERWILGAAALAAMFALVDALWLTPALAQRAQAAEQLARKRNETQQLNAQALALAEQVRREESDSRERLARLRSELGLVAQQLGDFERTLVPARQMAAFLRGVLPARGELEIVSLRSLPPTPLLVRSNPGEAGRPVAPVETSAPPGPATLPAAAGATDPANLYKHGVEVRVAGSYAALLRYLAALEQAPQKVLWGQLTLRVDEHPRSELTLVIYTLSLDPSWLAV